MEKTKNIDVFLGMQYGSEGKGKVCAYFSQYYDHAVRIGGPNAGHCVHFEDGSVYKMQTVPVAWVNNKTNLYICRASLIDEETLARESKLTDKDKLFIDKMATFMLPEYSQREKDAGLFEKLGSTQKGIGVARSERVMRRATTMLNAQIKGKENYMIIDTTSVLQGLNVPIMIETSQGHGLGLYRHEYPFCTSSDISVANALSEVGLPPNRLRYSIGIFRTYPIRVAGNSGSMRAETTWDDIAKKSGYANLEERTTVTNRIRRVSEIDFDLLREADRLNNFDFLVMTFADYIDSSLRCVNRYSNLNKKAKDFIQRVMVEIQKPVAFVSTCEHYNHMINMWGHDLSVNFQNQIKYQ